jgi:hypothetical protein
MLVEPPPNNAAPVNTKALQGFAVQMRKLFGMRLEKTKN